MAALSDEDFAIFRRLEERWSGKVFGWLAGLGSGSLIEGPSVVADGCRFVNQFGQGVGVEVDVGKGCEDGFKGEGVNLRVAGAELGGAMGILADTLESMDQQVLQRR